MEERLRTGLSYRSGLPDPPLSLRDISPRGAGGEWEVELGLRGNDGGLLALGSQSWFLAALLDDFAGEVVDDLARTGRIVGSEGDVVDSD